MRAAYLYLLLINLLDYLTTSMLIFKQGFEVEANPFLYHLMVIMESTYPILVVKLIMLAAYGLALYALKILEPKRYALPGWKWATMGLGLLLTPVVIGSIVLITTL